MGLKDRKKAPNGKPGLYQGKVGESLERGGGGAGAAGDWRCHHRAVGLWLCGCADRLAALSKKGSRL